MNKICNLLSGNSDVYLICSISGTLSRQLECYARLFRTISRNLKLKRKGKGKGKGSPELHHPNGGAISGAGGVG